MFLVHHFKIIVIIFSVFFTYACDSNASGVQHIDNKTLKQLIQQGIPVIDVRTTTEWKKIGIVEGSHLLMFYDEKGKYDLEKWLNNVANIVTKDEPVVLICHSGGRSKQLAEYLVKEVGYQSVYNVKKGIVRWIKDKNPTIAP